MKVKKQRNINTILLACILILVSLWITYNYIKSLDMHPTLEDLLVCITCIGMFWMIIETVEVILMRHGQRKWTHHPGRTLVEMIKDAFTELSKDKEAQQALTDIMAFCGDAFMRGMPDEGGNTQAGRDAKIILPDGYEKYEKFVNQPGIKQWLKKKFKDLTSGGEKDAASRAKAKGPKFE